MNERPSTTTFREGFVDPNAQPAQPHAPAQQAPPAQPVPQAMPPPEIEPALVEQDAAPVIVQEKWPVVVKLLYKPLVIPGDRTYNELSFREPRAGDINRYGNPCRVNQDGEVLIEERKMHYVMSALSGVLPPYLELLDPRDWNSCAYRLRHFFAPDPRAWLLEQTKP
jgi:Phage tail assembly chaperone proteins, E, or 41 or 14